MLSTLWFYEQLTYICIYICLYIYIYTYTLGLKYFSLKQVFLTWIRISTITNYNNIRSVVILLFHWFTHISKGLCETVSQISISPRLIIVNLTRAGELYIDLYGIDNPHLRLQATTTTTTVMSMGDNCLISYITSWEALCGHRWSY